MSSSDRTTLLEFGFSEAKVNKALRVTKNAGLQPALDWLADHAEEADPVEGEEDKDGDVKMGTAEEGDEEGAPGGAAEAKSLKCLVCGKVFRNSALASYHGEKSGHDQFEESTEEIKPLTEEEKKEKLKDLKMKMAEKKKLNAKREAEEAKQNEAIRRKGGQDLTQIKADMALKEAEKAALERANDKKRDLAAKKAVLLQIDLDKKARAERNAREKALREGRAPPPVVETPAAAPSSSTPGEKKVYTTTRLQIRLPSGEPPLVTTVESGSTLGMLRTWVGEQEAAGAVEEIVFSSAFPRKTFGEGDMDKTIEELGLSPSASLLLS